MAIIAFGFGPIIVNLVRLEMAESVSEKRQRALHAQIFKDVIRPAAHWVKSFRATQGTLPSQLELATYASNSFSGTYIVIFTNASEGDAKWKNPGVDFELFVPVRDWNLFYQSWDDKEKKYYR